MTMNQELANLSNRATNSSLDLLTRYVAALELTDRVAHSSAHPAAQYAKDLLYWMPEPMFRIVEGETWKRSYCSASPYATNCICGWHAGTTHKA